MALNAKQKRFVSEYLIDQNATQAAIRAGYSKKTAYSSGPRMLENVEVKEAVAKGLKRLDERTNVTAERVRQELAILGYADLSDYVEFKGTGAKRGLYLKPFADLPPGATAAISELIQEPDGRIRIKLHNKNHALELLGRNQKMFTDKHELTGANGGPIQVDDLGGLSDTQRAARVAAILDAARARGAGQAPVDGSPVAPAAGPPDTGVSESG